MKTIIKNVSKSFGDTEVLRDISLEIARGEFVVLIGPSGCGKTTLLKIVAGFIPLTAGTVEMDDRVVASSKKIVPPNKRNLSMVFQNFALWPHYDVRRQLLFPLNHHRYIPESIKSRKEARVDEVLEMVGLTEFKHRYPHELSGGQKQRVALARAIAAQPGLMLMDEPLSSLDAHLKQEIRNEIKTISQNVDSSFLYVTHDQSEALSLADKIVVMNRGAIVQVGTPEEVYNYPKDPFVAKFVGKHNLIPGAWENDTFRVEDVEWEKSNVGDAFKQEGLIPVRPDELKIDDTAGVSGVVESVYFQGNQYELNVETAHGEIKLFEQFGKWQVGDKVYVNQR